MFSRRKAQGKRQKLMEAIPEEAPEEELDEAYNDDPDNHPRPGYEHVIPTGERTAELANRWGAIPGTRCRPIVDNGNFVELADLLDDDCHRLPLMGHINLSRCDGGWTPLADVVGDLDTKHIVGDCYELWTGNPDEPTFREAMNGPDREQWCVTYACELSNHEGMGTWDKEESQPPVGQRAIPTKVVLLKKRNDRGEVLTFKARLGARGDLQRPGDYGTTYAPTARIASVRILNVLAHVHRWRRRQFDVNNAYLNADVSEQVWIQLPDKTVHCLRRSIYGLKQAGHDWNQTLHDELTKSHGFVRIEEDRGMYRRVREVGGKSHSFAGNSILATRGFTDCKPASTPWLDSYSLSGHVMDTSFPYRSVIGELLWLTGCTRPDLLFTVAHLARFMSDPQAEHIARAKHVLRYLKGTASLGLVYHRDLGTEIVPYSDADHAGDKSSRVSVSGHVVQMAGCAITWSARRQTGVAHSSVEAEYVALSCREVMWLRSLLVHKTKAILDCAASSVAPGYIDIETIRGGTPTGSDHKPILVRIAFEGCKPPAAQVNDAGPKRVRLARKGDATKPLFRATISSSLRTNDILQPYLSPNGKEI
ncbi:BQ5605_C006g04338 [Microbotryum silenes-dioicae]|uniref:BQ5605_C006g04338 protein n=1 Tax=Microbotryum silenes-dioicae TaxID=796604 RepID=A0A2X0MTU1_9BASI|nr:BQ5605_C006g04338 [Microbotryum silenes-dioicae]